MMMIVNRLGLKTSAKCLAEVCFVIGVDCDCFSNDIINTGIEITGYSINQ